MAWLILVMLRVSAAKVLYNLLLSNRRAKNYFFSACFQLCHQKSRFFAVLNIGLQLSRTRTTHQINL
jgi:hypothetical protein